MSAEQLEALGRMVEQWSQITSQVERGYGLTFDDYLNDMDLRRLIDERIRSFLEVFDRSFPASMLVALAVADDRFRQSTILSATNIWGDENARDNDWNAEREWYYYRLPEEIPKSW